MKNGKQYLLPLLVLGLSISGSLLMNHYLIYIGILGTLAVAGLVVFGKIDGYLPFIIFTLALSVLYQTTLWSPYLIGNDIHSEYYYFQRALGNGWDVSIPSPHNSSLLLTVIAPFLSRLFHVEGYVVFKWIFPLFLAGVPVISYLIFTKYFNRMESFLGSIFIVFLPSYTLEITGIAKMEVAEFFFVSLFLLLLSSTLGKKRWWGCLILGSLLCTLHYTMSMVALLYMAIGLMVYSVLRYLFKQKSSISIKVLIPIILLIGAFSFAYLALVAQGTALYSIAGLGKFFIGIPTQQKAQPPPTESPDFKSWTENTSSSIWIPEYKQPTSEGLVRPQEERESEVDGPIVQLKFLGPLVQTPLSRLALGLDFFEVTFPSKVFRIFQLLTQIFIVVGSIWVLWNRRRFPAEYLALFIVSWIILLLCFSVPGFQSILNATRWYQITALFIAPALIVGGRIILRGYRILFLLILVPYFLFTSGIVFEAIRAKSVETTALPYSVALSSHRLDVASVYTKNDKAVARYIYTNDLRPIVSDFRTFSLLEEYWGKEGGYGLFSTTPTASGVPSGLYILMSEWNIQSQTITYWYGIGLRKSFRWSEKNIDKILDRCNLVYQVGNARLYRVR